MIQLILSVLILSFASAQECMDESRPLVLFSSEVLNLANVKECPGQDELILKKVKDEYQKFYGKLPQVKRAVKGFSLKASDKEISIANAILGSKPPKGWKAAATGCETLQCAFEKLFKSKEAAMQIFNITAKSGYRLILSQSINQNLKEQIWSPKEVREMDAMISKLPKELKNVSHLQDIKRMGDGLRLNGDSAQVAAYARPGSNAEIVSYDAGMHGLTSGKNPYEATSWPQEAITHEICHHHDFKGLYASNYSAMTSEQNSSAFRKISGWKEKTGPKGGSSWVSASDAEFVSWYAQTSPAEDYAETCMNYLLHPSALETKAPKKYAYMKKYLFNGREFKNEPWASKKSVNWPKFNELLADESECNTKLAACIQDLKHEDKFCLPEKVSESMSYYSCGTVISQIQNSSCFKGEKSARSQELDEILKMEENYCEMGGGQLIAQNKDQICSKSLNKLSNDLNAAVSVDVKSLAEICEEANDFTSACITDKALALVKASPEFSGPISKILSTKIPARMDALAMKLEKINTGTWLKACLSTASKIEAYTVTDDKGGSPRNMFSYESGSKDFTSGYMGKYIYKDYKTKDINSSCGEKMIQALAETGIKTPESGSVVNLMKKPFLDELNSFEADVILQVGPATKKCLMAKCKVKKITELLEAWEQKDPIKRKGFSQGDYASELKSKVSSFP